MKAKILKISGLLFLAMFLLNNVKAQEEQDLVQKCSVAAGADATYLKDFVVKLDAAGTDNRPPMYRQSLALRKNVTYRFSICNMEESEGEAVLRVYDQANMILSTWYPDSGKEFDKINFKCMKSGVYMVVISFKEGKKGEAIGILSYVSN
ncbi:MAG: hypothetical protein K9H49_18270 [Bacteroidales bacterium]|nr:hypothetical protein [Bacteroidales bacterium]MCF8391486.1 hypothetical protein [Bacteroidales bacterium]